MNPYSNFINFIPLNSNNFNIRKMKYYCIENIYQQAFIQPLLSTAVSPQRFSFFTVC